MNAGFDTSQSMGLMHHVGMLEISAGYEAARDLVMMGATVLLCAIDGFEVTDSILEVRETPIASARIAPASRMLVCPLWFSISLAHNVHYFEFVRRGARESKLWLRI